MPCEAKLGRHQKQKDRGDRIKQSSHTVKPVYCRLTSIKQSAGSVALHTDRRKLDPLLQAVGSNSMYRQQSLSCTVCAGQVPVCTIFEYEQMALKLFLGS